MPKKHTHGLSRRQFLKATLVSTAGAAALSGGLNLAVAQMTYNEAPALAELVAAGELPAVADRLPDNPVVVEPLDSVGVYGGAIRSRMIANRGFQVRSMWGPEGILRIDWDSSTVVPNIAESWEYSNDGKTFTLKFRPGMKWSDGEPFTSDDVAFWWNHVILNEDLTPSSPNELTINGKLAEFEQVDAYTVNLHFEGIPANLPLNLAHAFGVNMVEQMPRHYLEQFHPDFVEEAELNARIEEEGFENWMQLFNSHSSSANYGMPQLDVNQPVLLPYKLSKPLELNLMVAERNPYYWKVDTEGNQLPYIDQVIITNVENQEVSDAIITAGEMNYVNTDTTFANFPLYQDNAEANHYEVRNWNTNRGAEHAIMLNHTTTDEVLRGLINDVRFKQALSYAIDRQTISDVLYLGFGIPSQYDVIPASAWYDEERVARFTEYDVDRANELLDEIGLTERNDAGIRLRPDGEPLTLRLDYQVAATQNDGLAELLREFWGEVGVDLDARGEARDLLRSQIDNNEIEVGIWQGGKSSDILFQTLPYFHVPFTTTDWNQWGIEWARYYETNGEAGEEPPEEIKRIQDLYTEMQVTVDQDRRLEIGKEILESNVNNLWTIGTVAQVPLPIIIGDNMRNIPEVGFTGFDWLGNHQYHVEQVYFDGGKWSGAPS